MCCDSWGHKESDVTEQLNNKKKMKSSESGKLKDGVFLRALIMKNQSMLGRWNHIINWKVPRKKSTAFQDASIPEM